MVLLVDGEIFRDGRQNGKFDILGDLVAKEIVGPYLFFFLFFFQS
jgi:hypothetical protein